ncbi:MAG TPA: peptidylprolyl isomerase [Chthoniobacterales bacterium]|nr:peptidylprolyl isomerase [Chthoniobacterales bacterium]
MGKRRLSVLIAIACVAGVIGSEMLCRWDVFRDAAGRRFGRGRLIAITGGAGIYERDLDGDAVFTASELVAVENLRRVARNEQTDATKIDHELSLLRAQFISEKAFARTLASSGLSLSTLREKIGAQLRSLQWLEKQLTDPANPTENQCRQFYEAHRGLFAQPIRFRASHIFLAAPAETPPEAVEAKGKLIEALAVRLSRGEAFFSQLAAEASEDEATKARGGDLGFFSSARMPPEFFAEVGKLRAGQTSKPFHSPLGFHIVQVTEIKPARGLNFEEVRAEAALAITNGRRALLAEGLTETLGRADYVRAE